MRIPLKSIVIGLISFIWVIISIRQWGMEFYDLDKLLFAIGFFLMGIYVAYDQWFKKSKEEELEDIKKDVTSMCQSFDRLETKIIEMNQ